MKKPSRIGGNKSHEINRDLISGKYYQRIVADKKKLAKKKFCKKEIDNDEF